MSCFNISLKMSVAFSRKNHPIEIFTRAKPGSSLVWLINVFDLTCGFAHSVDLEYPNVEREEILEGGLWKWGGWDQENPGLVETEGGLHLLEYHLVGNLVRQTVCLVWNKMWVIIFNFSELAYTTPQCFVNTTLKKLQWSNSLVEILASARIQSGGSTKSNFCRVKEQQFIATKFQNFPLYRNFLLNRCPTVLEI